MKVLRRLWRSSKTYVTQDLKEIVFPSSLPNPPGYTPPPKLTRAERWAYTKKVFQIYLDSFDSKKLEKHIREQGVQLDEDLSKQEEVFKDIALDFAAAARGGSKTLKIFFQEQYKYRAAAYRDSIKAFIEGYREGFREESQKKNALDHIVDIELKEMKRPIENEPPPKKKSHMSKKKQKKNK